MDYLLQGVTAKSLALSRILYFESQMHRRMGLVRPQRYVRLWNYYAGTNLPPNNVDQPLNVNYYKEICDKHTSFLWGQYEDTLIDWSVRPKDKAKPEDKVSIQMQRWLDQLMLDNNCNTLLYDGSLNGSVFGDTVYRLRYDILDRRVAIENLLPEYFHCRWNPANMTQLLEVIVAYPIDRMDALEMYGSMGNPSIQPNIINPDYLPGMGIYWEHWTTKSYQIWIDDMLVQSGPNPYMWQDPYGNVFPGIIPFVHIPNMRMGGEFYGFGDAEGICLLQDDLNRRLADLGDIVNNFAHPIVGLQKFSGDVEDLPVGPDVIWDLGREGDAKIIEAKGSPISMEYIGQLMMAIHDTSALPELAFGRQARSGGRSQSSATAMQLILMPTISRARRKRIQWEDGLRQIAHAALFIQQVYEPDAFPFPFKEIANYRITPTFGPPLPKDRLQSVNENVALVINGLRSMSRALEDLGEEDIADEIKDIMKESQWRALLAMGGKNSDSGQGGSPLIPGGPGSNTKPGQPAKDASGGGNVSPALQSFMS